MTLRLSLYRQIVLVVSLVLATSVAAYGWLVSIQQGKVYGSLFIKEMELSARNMAELCAHHLTIEDYAAMEQVLLRAADLPNILSIRVCEPNGQLLVDIVRSPAGQPQAQYNAAPIVPPAAVKARHEFNQEREVHVVWHPISAGKLMGWLQVTVSNESMAALKRAVWKSAALMASLCIFAGVVLLLISLRTPLASIHQLAEFARMLNTRKGEEIDVDAKAQEVRELAAALNLASRELHSSEEILMRERERLAVIIRSIRDGVIACDREGHILLMNQACERLLACSSCTGQLLGDLLPVTEARRGEVRSLLNQVMMADRVSSPEEFQTIFTLPTGDTKTVVCAAAPLLDSCGEHVGTVMVIRDITEKVRMEAEKHDLENQLHQAQKMEAIGTLAGGIAHDFNNILTAISGYAELTQLDLSEGSPSWQHIKEVLTGCNRAKDLVRQILAFSRKTDQEQMPIQVHLILKEAMKLLRSSLPTTIDFRQNISTQCGSVLANPTEIHQIIMNLCVNAFHAMRDQGHGELKVDLEPVVVEPEDVEGMGMEISPGHYVCLSVSDTGHGMDEAVKERIFDPYFTTKKMGEGTGMGLAVVHGIVKRGNGHIKVASELGKGATFKVYLPVFQATGTGLPLGEALSATLPPPGGNERILLVDDEAAIINLGVDLLLGLGYQVTSTSSSQQALEMFNQAPYAWDLVFTDFTMPGMNGIELAQAMLRIRPDLPVILCSGYNEAFTAAKASDIGIRAYIQKPYPRRVLAQTIRTTLDAQLVSG